VGGEGRTQVHGPAEGAAGGRHHQSSVGCVYVQFDGLAPAGPKTERRVSREGRQAVVDTGWQWRIGWSLREVGTGRNSIDRRIHAGSTRHWLAGHFERDGLAIYQ